MMMNEALFFLYVKYYVIYSRTDKYTASKLTHPCLKKIKQHNFMLYL